MNSMINFLISIILLATNYQFFTSAQASQENNEFDETSLVPILSLQLHESSKLSSLPSSPIDHHLQSQSIQSQMTNPMATSINSYFGSPSHSLATNAGYYGGHHSSDHGKYYQYASVPAPHTWKFGYRRGNSHHTIERHEHGHGPHFKTKVKWTDKHKSHGVHIYDYNHSHKHHDDYHHGASQHFDDYSAHKHHSPLSSRIFY